MACSLFLGIWRCIVGAGDDINQEKETLPISTKRDISPYYDTPHRSYVPTATNSTTAPTCPLLWKPSGACTTTAASSAHVPPQITAPSSYSNSWNSARTKLPETVLNVYSAKPKAAIHSPAGKSHDAGAQKPKILAPSPLPTGPTANKSHEAAVQKTKKVAPSPFPADFSPLRRQAVDHANDETSVQTLPSDQLSSSSSQPWPSLTKLPASSSKTLPYASTPRSPPQPPVSSFSSSEWLAPCSRTSSAVPKQAPSPVLPLSSSSSSLGTPLSTPKPQRPSSKPLLPLAPSNPTNPNSKTAKLWVEKDPSSVYSLPSSSKTLPSVSTPRPPPVSSLSSPVPLTEWNAPCPRTLPPVSVPPPPPVSPLSSSSSGTPPSTPKPHRPSSKPILSLAPPNPTNRNSKTRYVWVEKDTSSVYAIPKDFKDLIKNDVVPEILKRPLSPSTYKDYFEALLYAEDFYLEKWDNFEMENVALELEEASIYKRKGKYNKKNVDDEKDDKLFVTFELDSIPERRPYLLSRDFVFVSPSGTIAEPFQGLIYRVVKSNRVLVEFGEDFHAQHYEACEYHVKFSFNRVCLKRAHQAVATVSDPLFRNLLFPDSVPKNSLLTNEPQSINSKLGFHEISAVRHILSHQNAVPYLVEGPLARTRDVVCEAVLQLYRTSLTSCRILICAPTNRGCDDITRSFMGKIPKSSIFRANAAFRELEEVPEDILASCRYKTERECFSCPPIRELQRFDVISSTYMSSFRLHNEGIMAGHFSHIFLVDASTIIEPEAMVPLASLANESTFVTVTGAPGDRSRWIRSPIATDNGLLISYFQRLRQSKLYDSLDPKVITVL